MKFRVASLFSGAGGLDLGFHLDNVFKVDLANEILPWAAATYAHNFHVPIVDVAKFRGDPDLPCVVLGDVSKLDVSDLMKPFHVLVGGPPCQDFSIVRGPQAERAGIRVARGRLYRQFMRVLLTLKPLMFVFENVPGLLTANAGHAYRTIVEDFTDLRKVAEELGLNHHAGDYGYRLLNSGTVSFKNLGVPQDRRRIVIIGIRNDLTNIGEQALEELRSRVESALQGKSELFRIFPLTPMETFEGNTLSSLDRKYRRIIGAYDGLWNDLDSAEAHRWKHETWDKLTMEIVKDYKMANRIEEPLDPKLFDKAMDQHARDLRELGYLNRSVETRDQQPPPDGNGVMERMKMIPPGSNHDFVRGTKWAVEGRGMSLIYRRLHPLKPSYTVVAYGGGGTWGYHYDRSRATLSMIERARLQTFPDSFSFQGNHSQVRAQIGEAVPPLAARKIAGIVSATLVRFVQAEPLAAYA